MFVSMTTLAIAAMLSGQGFYPIGEHHGVKVYRRDTSGIELGAEGDIPAPPDRVLAVLTDYANHPKWVKGLAESKVLARDANSVVVYQRLNLPVLDDRDFTLHATWGDLPDGGRWLKFVTANDRGPRPVQGVVRVHTHDGAWQLEPIDGGRATHAIYRFHLDLAGSFPAWMGKGKAGKDVPNLFENLRNQVQYYR
jgi:hypothetical protein